MVSADLLRKPNAQLSYDRVTNWAFVLIRNDVSPFFFLKQLGELRLRFSLAVNFTDKLSNVDGNSCYHLREPAKTLRNGSLNNALIFHVR